MILAALAGFALCAGITRKEHRRDHPLWGRRLGRSRFRCADLPLGGCVFAVLWLVLLLFGLSLPPLLAVAAGMSLAAPMGRVLDPLPRLR